MCKKLVLCFFLLLCTTQKIYCWWDVPHMVVVQIAKDQLDPATIERAEELIRYCENDFPQSNTLVTAACFADDITSLGLSGFKVWHGVLTPYSADGFLTDREIGCIKTLINDNNLLSAIRQSLKTLKNPAASKWEKYFMLRFLLHTVADIHQPLHCAQLYNEQFPHGDLAGHRFLITGTPYRSLHVLWDAAFGVGAAKMYRPLNQDDSDTIQTLSRYIASCYPPESLPERNIMDIAVWSEESYELAAKVAYLGIFPGEVPSEEYMEKRRDTALRQIALAGYRLANLLKDLFGEGL